MDRVTLGHLERAGKTAIAWSGQDMIDFSHAYQEKPSDPIRPEDVKSPPAGHDTMQVHRVENAAGEGPFWQSGLMDAMNHAITGDPTADWHADQGLISSTKTFGNLPTHISAMENMEQVDAWFPEKVRPLLAKEGYELVTYQVENVLSRDGSTDVMIDRAKAVPVARQDLTAIGNDLEPAEQRAKNLQAALHMAAARGTHIG